MSVRSAMQVCPFAQALALTSLGVRWYASVQHPECPDAQEASNCMFVVLELAHDIAGVAWPHSAVCVVGRLPPLRYPCVPRIHTLP